MEIELRAAIAIDRDDFDAESRMKRTAFSSQPVWASGELALTCGALCIPHFSRLQCLQDLAAAQI